MSALVLLLAATAGANDVSAHAHGATAAAPLVATAAFSPDGTLWLARVETGHVIVSASNDVGKTFSPVVRVNPEPERIDANGEARPKVAIGPEGEVFVSYTRRLEGGYRGEVRFSRSVDGGRTFSAPVALMDGLSSGRFDTLAVSPRGEVHVFFIGRADTKESSLHHAISRDRGKTFSPSRRVKAGVCECCRLALAWEGDTPVLFWRDILEGGVRDHGLARVEADGEPAVVRATDDGWTIPACPHHGPAFTLSGGVQHLAWFTGDGQRGRGAFYRRSPDGGRTFSAPMRLGGDRAGHPHVLAAGKVVWLAWKELREDKATAVVTMRSADAGATWSKPVEVARTSAGSDHPWLMAHGDRAFLSWNTGDAGYRLLPLD